MLVEVYSVVGGTLIVLLVAVDLGAAVLHPSVQGPLSRHVEHATWIVVRGLARRLRSPRLLSFGGPAAMGSDLIGWLIGLWLGFALIYAPLAGDLVVAEGGEFDGQGIVLALYLSGVSLTTLGFGDVVAGTDVLRFVTVIEAAAGLAMITAAISLITAIYPRVSRLRVAASSATDLGADDEEGAARFVLQGGRESVASLQRDLIEVHQDLLRFPVLYYFHPPREGESIASLVRASALVCAQLRWGLQTQVAPFAPLYGPALQRTLEQLMVDYSWESLRGDRDPPAPEKDAEESLARLRLAANRAAPGSAADGHEDPEIAARFVRRVNTFLSELARVHAHEATPLLSGLTTNARH